MKKLFNLRDLLLEQIRDLYSAELMQMKALPILRDKATSRQLKKVIDQHVNETNEQVIRLDHIFNRLNERAQEENSMGMQCLIEQAMELCDRCADPEVMDAAIITAIQHINHYEIAGYGTTCSYAKALGADETASLLHETLEEEKDIDKQLSKLAEGKVNVKANATIV